MLWLGTAKRCITPQKPVRLCGYATRTAAFDGVKEDIWVRVHALQDGTERLFVVYADLLWWNSTFVDRIRREIFTQYGIGAQNLLFVASHNHSGPGTGNCFTPLLETGEEAYADFLSEAVLSALQAALENQEPVTVRRYETKCAMNVYRRVKTADGVLMRPNYAVPADWALTALGFYRRDGSLKGAMLHYPCHANLSNENAVQPDYPGIALRLLDEAFPGSLSLFLQGCTADLRPNSVLGDRFVPCDYERVRSFAQNFFQQCRTLLQRPGKSMDGALRVSSLFLKLPLDQPFEKSDVQAALHDPEEAKRQWAEKVIEKNFRPYETMEIACVVIAGQILFGFNAEMSQAYAAFARVICPGALCAGYTNGMIGYLAAAGQIREGGYEPVGSAVYFALAGTYSVGVEALIHDAMEKLSQDGAAKK